MQSGGSSASGKFREPLLVGLINAENWATRTTMRTPIRAFSPLVLLTTTFGICLTAPMFGQTFAVLHNFGGIDTNDGGWPRTLFVCGTTLYGTVGGVNGTTSAYGGPLFKVKTDGTGYAILRQGLIGPVASPAGLIQSGTTLYGLDHSSIPVAFKMNIDGTGWIVLHTFDGGTNGSSPVGLLLSSNTLYGITTSGGSSNAGLVFSLTLPPPQMDITPSGGSIIVTWPTNDAGYMLKSTTNLSTTAWSTVSSVPALINGRNSITNALSDKQRFYRLSQ